MARHNFGQMKAQAEAEGLTFKDAVVLPDNDYSLEIKAVKYSPSKNGKDQVGVKFLVLDGPYVGQETWVNQTLTGDNPQSVAIFVRVLKSLGVPEAAFVDDADTADLVRYIVKGTRGVGKLTATPSKTDPSKLFQNLRSFTATQGAATPAPVSVAPPVVAAVTPVAAPVTAAPVAPIVTPVTPY